jgi:hypothetical protein
MQKLMGHGLIRLTQLHLEVGARGWYALTITAKGKRFVSALERKAFP